MLIVIAVNTRLCRCLLCFHIFFVCVHVCVVSLSRFVHMPVCVCVFFYLCRSLRKTNKRVRCSEFTSRKRSGDQQCSLILGKLLNTKRSTHSIAWLDKKLGMHNSGSTKILVRALRGPVFFLFQGISYYRNKGQGKL